MVAIIDINISRRQEPAPDLIRGRNREKPSEVYSPLVGLPVSARLACLGQGSPSATL